MSGVLEFLSLILFARSDIDHEGTPESRVELDVEESAAVSHNRA